MFLPARQSRYAVCAYGLLSLITLALTSGVEPGFAHKVKVEGDVGATLHIEPNDTPRAGEPSQTWFALTRKGGKIIPLAECNCQLSVYAEPHVAGETPLLQPTLKAVTAERYRGIPGTVINFPRPGAYQLQLSGKPSTGQGFRPFTLKFDVTVAVGSNNKTAHSQPTQPVVSTEDNKSNNWILPVIAIAFLSAGFISFFVLRRGKG
ncbi:MAG: hypothetical protein QNJ36_11695 [Calothrix sp. MO_167.B42]|nr:hypothetical protein [Calothrix sp. MO_167.B42]